LIKGIIGANRTRKRIVWLSFPMCGSCGGRAWFGLAASWPGVADEVVPVLVVCCAGGVLAAWVRSA
jgi:hypothetical protein